MRNADLSKTKTFQWKALFQYLAQPEVSEIVINGPEEIFMTYKGRSMAVPPINDHQIKWDNADDFYRGAEDLENNMLHYGKSIRDSRYLFEGSIRLRVAGADEIRARTHIILPPVAVNGFPQITMVKNDLDETLQSIESMGTMNKEMAEFLRLLIDKKKTIVISGGSGAGKTTLLAAMTKGLKKWERVIVCEDAPELDIRIPNVSQLASYPAVPGAESNTQATLSWVVAQVNRMRPSRIIIGETRGPEFADFLTAANSGYEGSLTTIHANSPKKALSKMARFVRKAPGSESMPMAVINQEIADTIDYVVQIQKDKKTGKHFISEITEISNIINDKDGADIKVNPIWEYEQESEEFKRKGYPEDDDIREGITEASRIGQY